ncbi:MAG: hypothetical protein LBC83_01150 [Oscillospiraceae bacterium]|jgi:hypothetical protein|nr:hypothetical protein [Oscillospiraceae bacterium]
MKKAIVILFALALAAGFFGCGEQEQTDGDTFNLPSRSTTESSSESQTSATSETSSESWSYPWDSSSPASSSASGSSQTKPPAAAASGKTNPPATPNPSTQKTTQKPTTTTQKPKSTQFFANPITINSSEGALKAFNDSIARVMNAKPGFSKDHLVTYKNWSLDPNLQTALTFPIVGDYSQTIFQSIGSAINSGARTATFYKGDTHNVLRNDPFAMGDLKDGGVSYKRDGSDWLVTLNVKNGSTRQQKKLFGSGVSGDSPIDKGPLALATGDGGVYDHMSADRIFSMINNYNVNSLVGVFSIEPIDISESTERVIFTARLDGEGKLISLVVTYNQTVNLSEVLVMSGTPYKNNTGSASVKISFSDFSY